MEVDSNEVERSDLDADTEVNYFIPIYFFDYQTLGRGCHEKWPQALVLCPPD